MRALFLAVVFASQPTVAAADGLRAQASALFGVVEPVTAADIADPQVQLGRARFWDTRLSVNGTTACASCHPANDWGADRRRRSPDARGEPTKRHSQSVFNAQAATAGLRWTADRRNGAEQALGSITGSMGFASREALIPVLRDRGYAAPFEKAFPASAAPLSVEHYAQALEAYQRTLRTPAPFDRWLAGDDGALEPQQLRGLKGFVEAGCGGCHSGALFGGGSLQRFGATGDYRRLTGSEAGDTGLMGKTGKASDRDVFRVQPLRNVARTAPYFHDGSVAELGAAVAVMAKAQLGRNLSPVQIADMVRFLEALSAPLPPQYGPPEARSGDVSSSPRTTATGV